MARPCFRERLMVWSVAIAYFFAGAFLVNAVPHFVQGVSGRTFPSPFARPPGRGESSPLINVLWGFVNLVVGYLLLVRVGDFDPRSSVDMLLPGVGGLMMAVLLARTFGRVHAKK